MKIDYITSQEPVDPHPRHGAKDKLKSVDVMRMIPHPRMAGDAVVPYFVSCIRDGRQRRFLYPHVDIKTAMAVACEVWLTEVSNVWVSDEKGELVADKAAVLEALDDYEPAENMEEN